MMSCFRCEMYRLELQFWALSQGDATTRLVCSCCTNTPPYEMCTILKCNIPVSCHLLDHEAAQKPSVSH